jgi:hypothetical protein
MKALALTLAIIVSSLTLSANDLSTVKKGKDKESTFKEAVTAQVNKHLFFLLSNGERIEGQADVMLQVLPQGDVQVVLIQTKNPLVKKFIENQVKKMKIKKDEVVVGEILHYRFIFKGRN